MARKSSKSSPHVESAISRVPWKFTKCMNASDLSRDDDYVSHLFIEKISSLGATPLLVHRMDPKLRLPKTDSRAIWNIVQRITRARQNCPLAIKEGVNSLFEIPSVLYFIRDYDQRQINAFATHASRYLELYLPNGSIEIAQTSRYSRITGKNELCILATRPMPTGFLIQELKGSMAELTEEEDRNLKNPIGGIDGGRRDFSVIHSRQLKKNHLFLGPARFVNHDCDNNCELFRDGRYITFRTIKPIALGQELTAHYGEGYFGKNNRHCLCETCERRGKGGYAPQAEDNGRSSPNGNSNSDSENDSDSDTSSITSVDSGKKEEVNVNERRTRRGVYRIVQDEGDGSEDEEEEEESVVGLLYPSPKDNLDASSNPQTSSPEPLSTRQNSPRSTAMLPPKRRGRPPKEQLASADSPVVEKVSFKSVITTRGQKAREASMSSNGRSLSTASDNAITSTPSRHLRSRRSETVESSTAPAPSLKPRGRPRKHPLLESSISVPVNDGTTVGRSSSTRGRSSAASKASAADAAIAGKETTRRKVVPTVPSCDTCSSPLSADDIERLKRKAALYVEKEKGKGKGRAVHIEGDCQRCARHLAIWDAPWPHRIAMTGSRSSSTRENTPDTVDRISPANLAGVDLRLTEARLAQIWRIRDMNRKNTESIITTGSRAQLKRKRMEKKPAYHNKWGCLRLSNIQRRDNPIVTVNPTEIKVENADEVSLPDHGKKRAANNALPATSANNRKRARLSEVVDEAIVPSLNPPVDDDGDDRRDKTFWPAEPPFPPVGDGIKRTGLLNLRPNPNSVSRWRSSPLCAGHSIDSTPTLVEDDSDETTADEHPATPENNGVRTPEVMEDVEEASVVGDLPPASDEDEAADDAGGNKGPVSTLKGLGLIAKPSPLILSKRAWAPPARIADSDSEDLHIPSPEQARVKRRRKDQGTSDLREAETSGPDSPKSHVSLSELSINSFKSRVKKGMFDDFEASSGEEDVILPGPSNSRLFRLQRNAFRTLDSAQTSLQASPNLDVERAVVTPKPSPPHVTVTLTSSPSLAKILNQSVLTLGPLHSDFLPPSPVPVPSPSFVNAGWDAGEDSDSSTGHALND